MTQRRIHCWPVSWLVVQKYCSIWLTAAIGSAALAHPGPLEEVTVEGRELSLLGEARSASEGMVGQADLAPRPLLRPGDMLEAIPGMIVTQHSGSGKSNQMFLRGFNLDHGTDFATWVNGMPINMRTHGHGQGYTDINFLIPETIQSLQFVKGPYHAELGDFSSAGGTDIQTFETLDDVRLKLGFGENGFRRLLTMSGTDTQFGQLVAALEAQRYAGPWDVVDEDAGKLNGLITVGSNAADLRWSITAMAYDNEWNSADQIPARAVSQGLISELGSLDDSLGGNSRRLSLSSQLRQIGRNGGYELAAYAIDYRMQLWSNFTYLLDRPQTGDQFEQFDDRTIWGAAGKHFWFNGPHQHVQHTLGFDLRYDDIGQVGLYESHQRQRLGTICEDSVKESSLGLYYELEWEIEPAWRLLAGLRGDVYHFDVTADEAHNSGSETDTTISPKLNLIYSVSDNVEAYISAGRGFHSNDARGTTAQLDPVSRETLAPVDPLVASAGTEIGLKTYWENGLNSSLALWYLKLDSELLFVGDAGNTEASRPSRRYGVELNNYWKFDDIWSLEVDLAWTHSSFDDDSPEGKDIPAAIPFVFSAALNLQYPQSWFASFRLRHFAAYPLIEDNSAESDGATFASLALGWQGKHWRFQLDVLNLFDTRDHDIDYFYASRLAGEPADGVEENHYKVFEPRQFRLHVSYTF